MAKFPRYTATTTARGSGLARAQDIGALTRTSNQAYYSGLGAFGRGIGAISDYAFRETQERHDIDTRLQHAKATSDYEGFAIQLSKQIQDSPVETNVVRREMHKSLMVELDKYYQGKLKELDNKDAIDAVKISWQRDRLRYDKAMWSTLSLNLDRYEAQNAENIIKNFIKNGNPEEAQRQADYYVSRGLFSKDNANNIVKMQTIDTDARNLLFTEGREKAISYIMSQDLDTDIKKKIVSDINFESYQQEEQKKILADQEEKAIETQLLNPDPKVDTLNMINNSLNMDAGKRYMWAERFRLLSERLAKGIENEADPRFAGALETMAYRIEDSGQVKSFRDKLNQAYYDDKIITDKEYTRLYSLGERKFDAHRDSEYAERMTSFTKQLLTTPPKSSDAYAALTGQAKSDADEHIQLESDNLDRCRASFRTWFANNPEADAAEIRKQGKIIETLFKKSPEQLKEEEAIRSGKKMNKVLGGTKTETFKKRVTVEKDGKKFTVPIEQLEEAKKQGYKEVK